MAEPILIHDAARFRIRSCRMPAVEIDYADTSPRRSRATHLRVADAPSSGEMAHNFADSHLGMSAAINMTAGHDAVLAGDMHQEQNSVS
ncbi:unnamed protein product, partial [Iphiclides podalirius]